MPVLDEARQTTRIGTDGVNTPLFPLNRPLDVWHLIRARYYDPAAGRFVQKDPIGIDSYAYAANNPVTYADPSGMDAVLTTDKNNTAWNITLYVTFVNATATAGQADQEQFEALTTGLATQATKFWSGHSYDKKPINFVIDTTHHDKFMLGGRELYPFFIQVSETTTVNGGVGGATAWLTRWSGYNAAHEVGHLLGLRDEPFDPKNPSTCIMVNTLRPTLEEKHLQEIVQLFQAHGGVLTIKDLDKVWHPK